jgi:hypothetical protein
VYQVISTSPKALQLSIQLHERRVITSNHRVKLLAGQFDDLCHRKAELILQGSAVWCWSAHGLLRGKTKGSQPFLAI